MGYGLGPVHPQVKRNMIEAGVGHPELWVAESMETSHFSSSLKRIDAEVAMDLAQ